MSMGPPPVFPLLPAVQLPSPGLVTASAPSRGRAEPPVDAVSSSPLDGCAVMSFCEGPFSPIQRPQTGFQLQFLLPETEPSCTPG